MQLLVTPRHGLETVLVVGDIDAASIDAIENVLLDILERSPHRVELDLSGVEFLDDAGHRMIARAREYARARRVALQIVRATRPNS